LSTPHLLSVSHRSRHGTSRRAPLARRSPSAARTRWKPRLQSGERRLQVPPQIKWASAPVACGKGIVSYLPGARLSCGTSWQFSRRSHRDRAGNEAPGNHFLRKLKTIALRGGLNCGQCKTIITKGEGDKRRKVKVSCKDHAVCEHFYLHRFRKTCATRWHEANIPVRTIQYWLGHKNLETTMLYLGVTSNEKLRGNIDRAFGD
jgi:Phage integrase family